MATCAGMEDRWVVGVGRSACATADPLPPLWQQMRFGQGRCRRVSVALKGWPLGWCQGLYRRIPEPPYISIHQEASGGKGKWSLCLKKAAAMTSEPCPHPPLSSLPPQSQPSPQSICIYSYTVAMTTATFHPLARALTSVIN